MDTCPLTLNWDWSLIISPIHIMTNFQAKRMIEERMKITNLEDRLKSEMTGAGAALPGDMNTTAEALRLALQQEERLKLELGNLKNMENLLGGAGIARMMQMMESGALPGGQAASGGLESGPASSSGSVPHSPKHGGQEAGGQSSGLSPEQMQQLRRDVELTKVTGSEASLQYQRDIGAHHGYRQQRPEAEAAIEAMEEEEEAEDVVYRKEVGDAVSVYPKDMSSEAMRGMGSHMEAGAMVYPQSPHYQGMAQAQGSD